MLVGFLKALVSWIIAISPPSPDLSPLQQFLPSNVYFLKKLLGNETKITTFVICPKCHALYRYSDCVITPRGGRQESAKCSNIKYPNHPPLFRRKKYNTVLLKSVKHGAANKLVPRKVYAYNSLKSSLKKLFSQQTQMFMTARSGKTFKLLTVNHFFNYLTICV